MKNVFIITFILTCFSVGIIAQKTIIIESADIIETRLNASGRNLVVLTAKEIASMPINSTDELLRFLPGIELQSRGGFGAQSDVTMRGSTFNQVLIMIDGVRITDPLTGHFNGYIPLSLNEIYSVEIIKGAAASIYGANAVGGVVNFVTVYGLYTIDEGAEVEIKGGSNAYYGLEASVVSQDSSNWFYGGSIQLNKSKGEHFDNPNFINNGLGPDTYNTHFNLTTFSLAVGNKLNDDWRVYLRSSYDDRSFNAKYFYTSSSYDESVEETKVLFSQAKVIGFGEKTKTVIDLAHRYGEDEFAFNPLFSINNHRSQYYLLQVGQTYRYSKKVNFNYGTQADLRKVFSNDRGNHDDFHFGAYLLANVFLKPTLVINAGLRLDQDENYGTEINPHLNLLYEKKKLSFRGAISRAVRAADYTERFVSTEQTSLAPGRSLGNPNLQAESSWNAEVGVDYRFAKNQRVSTTYFSRYSKNLIDYYLTSGFDIETSVLLDGRFSYNYATNIGEVVTNGFEIDWRGNYKMDRKTNLIYGLGYTWLETNKNSSFWGIDSENNTSDFTLSKYLASHAKHLVNGHFSIIGKKLAIGGEAIWKNRKTGFSDALGFPSKKDYLLVDAFVNYSITQKLKIGFEVHNIGDVQAQDVFGSILPGRWLIGSLSMKI